VRGAKFFFVLCDFSRGTIRKDKEKFPTPRGKFRLMENGLRRQYLMAQKIA
jgi:hypothetical protein